jgi:glycosyltransferase involved in cell wall biosynthesis
VIDGAAFRAAHGLGDDDLMLGIVSRLEPDMKAEGVRRTMDALRLAPAARLVVAGDGPSYGALNEHADKVNAELGRRAVIMTGALADPRPAYAAADIALGMGGSALRSMAFGKPLIVLGVRGFAQPFEPATAAEFLTRGFFGEGGGDLSVEPLAAHIRRLAADVRLRRDLGELSRRTVVDRFSLTAAAGVLDEVYQRAVAIRPVRVRDAVRVLAHHTASELLPERVKRWVRP